MAVHSPKSPKGCAGAEAVFIILFVRLFEREIDSLEDYADLRAVTGAYFQGRLLDISDNFLESYRMASWAVSAKSKIESKSGKHSVGSLRQQLLVGPRALPTVTDSSRVTDGKQFPRYVFPNPNVFFPFFEFLPPLKLSRRLMKSSDQYLVDINHRFGNFCNLF
ncbi:hypothetical protein M422DRAFT_277152 [Sphaerobolus stellatus SS14]|uniref:Uncharacterized protein n=1 Tax=Sphaerobolus stellatus (strain SS14) TaxID=990650 RepID=A0A0C9TKS2_SPHS4|nr:hypothetical protein M422DRAFT_277152 [Sphaerobolus stellatus SS14]